MLNLVTTFGSRANAATSSYPAGSYKDDTSATVKDGTPVAASTGNDDRGFRDSLLLEAGYTANNIVDTAIASQAKDAAKEVFSRPALYHSCLEAGLNLVAGSFEDGGTVTTPTDVLWDKTDKKIYSWGGTLPKVVSSGSTPASSGGIGAGAWVDRIDNTLRFDLIKSGTSVKNLADTNIRLSEYVYLTDYIEDGDDLTVDATAVFNRAFVAYDALIDANGGYDFGYQKIALPVLIVPPKNMICGAITPPSKGYIHIKCTGRATIQSLSGAASTPAGTWYNGTVKIGIVENISPIYWDTFLSWPTGNADQSRHELIGVNPAWTNLVLDEVSYSSARSTRTEIRNCTSSYGVKKFANIFADVSHIHDNWFTQSENTYFFHIDSNCTFSNNIIVPTGTTKTSKAVIFFEGSDESRSLLIDGVRFGSESGQSVIVVVGDVNKSLTSNAYRNQGVKIRNTKLASNASTFDPDSTGTAYNACIILLPPTTPQQSINFLDIEDCYVGPDKVGGVVQFYGTGTPSDLFYSDFRIYFDKATMMSATYAATYMPTSENLKTFLDYPIIPRNIKNIPSNGKMTPIATATAGTFKVSFKLNVKAAALGYFAPHLLDVTTITQGDSSSNNIQYGSVSNALVSVWSYYSGSYKAEIGFTNLVSHTSGINNHGSSAISAVFFGIGDTGSTTIDLSTVTDYVDVTIVYATYAYKTSCYIRHKYDATLKS